MKHIIKPALSLFLITTVCVVLLDFVYSKTQGPIESQREKTRQATMKEILKDADEFTEVDSVVLTGNMKSVYNGRRNGNSIGYIVELGPQGYSGEIRMMVGISSNNNKIAGMRVLRQTETPGLGTLAVKENFYKKYDGKELEHLSVVRMSPSENEIEAITSATITTVAITNAVNEAVRWYLKHVTVDATIEDTDADSGASLK